VWNGMVTHRVRTKDPVRIGRKVVDWLHDAYERAEVRTGAKARKQEPLPAVKRAAPERRQPPR